MAKVSLRIYNREIESLIEQERLDEAIAHCLHILKTFPKHVDTYRLLGKAYLEGRRYEDAADIFQRLLMAVPDDFVAHVGMSIIRDDEGKLDEAIWHMERAFEIQPSNAAIEAELRRLYGRRDGVEPPRIRMTRGALAHMYVQGELYPQAIGEIRAILAEDPNRVDMQVLLARAYFKAGQHVEASEISAALLKNYPYCLDANRILAEILPGTARAESTQTYRRRVGELDPYSLFVKGSLFDTDSVPDAAVSVERLEWKAGQEMPLQPGWTDSLGIKLKEERAEAEAPSQLQPAVEHQPQPAQESDEEDEIPPWLREAGWTKATGEASEAGEPPQAFEPQEEAVDEEELERPELPDWVKKLAPPEAQQEAEGQEAEKTPASESEPAAQGDLGDLGTSLEDQDAALAWLESLAAKQGAKAEELITNPQERTETPPEWIQEAMGQPSVSPEGEPPAEEDATGVWLRELTEQGTQSGEETPTSSLEPAEQVAQKSGETPPATPEEEIAAWLEGLEETETAETPAATVEEPSQPPSPPSPEEEVPDWLRDIAPEAPEAPPAEESEAESPALETEVPEWLSGLEDTSPEPEVATEGTAAAETEVPEWLSDLGPTPSEPEVPPAEEELPEWLRGEMGEEEPAVETPPQPTAPSEWRPVGTMEERPETAPQVQAGEGAPEAPPPVSPPEAKETPPQVIPPRRTGSLQALDATLARAQQLLNAGDINAALQEYSVLIKKGRLLEEVVYDLREALYRYPVDVMIWQTLGDAYMRANRLQDALDAYTKAEELLR